MKNELLLKRLRRKRRNRKNLKGTPEKPRLSVYRSCKNIYVQLIDDENNKTLAATSTLMLKKLKGNSIKSSTEVGKEIAKKALDLGVKCAIFDRGSYAYHGKVRAIAEAVRNEGLKI